MDLLNRSLLVNTGPGGSWSASTSPASVINLSAVPEAEGEGFDAIAPGSRLLEREPWSTPSARCLPNERQILVNMKTARFPPF